MSKEADLVRSLAEAAALYNLSSVEYQTGDTVIKISRGASSPSLSDAAAHAGSGLAAAHNHLLNHQHQSLLSLSPASVAASPAEQARDDNAVHKIVSQIVGTVYLASGPEADPFIKIGDQVKEGQTLFIIEAMKVMNQVKATASGVVESINVVNQDAVEYGSVLATIRRA